MLDKADKQRVCEKRFWWSRGESKFTLNKGFTGAKF